MNKLWARLSLGFGLVTVIGLLTVGLLIYIQVGNQFRQFVANNAVRNSALIERLSAYYEEQQSWSGIAMAFGELRRWDQSGGSSRPRRRIPSLILADAEGQIIYDRSNTGLTQLGQRAISKALPIENEGHIVGYLLPSSPGRSELSGPAQWFLGQVNWSLVQAGLIAGGLGIVVGFMMARGLTAPLGQLAAAARRISQGKLDQKVPVKGATEVAELAIAFNEMSAALTAAEQLRRNLVADVAHELRTPLSVLQGNLRAILDDVYALDKAEVAKLYDQTRLLNRLVNDLHELAQAEAHQLPLNRLMTDLTQLTQSTTETFAPLAESEGVILQTKLPDQGPAVTIDKARISQVLHNLLTNSLRHTPSGGIITVKLTPEQHTVSLVVSDTGDGIASEHLPHIFDRFYRADIARSRDKGGVGLGLAIARAIVEAHGGQISAASSGIPGQGSAFTISLPTA